MQYTPLSFLAGILTVLAPCILPVLPVIVGGSLQEDKDKSRPFIIVISLAISIFIFSLLLKGTAVIIQIDPMIWKFISGGIIIFFGIITIFPKAWDAFSLKVGFSNKSSVLLQKSNQRKGLLGNVLVGMSLGPVFASCSPTYFLIVGVILPQNLISGIVNLIVYIIGFSIVLLAIALIGQRVISKARWAADPHGWFKKILGVFFVITGVLIITGLDKKFTTIVLDSEMFDITKIERDIIQDRGLL